MNVDSWCEKWGISKEALRELRDSILPPESTAGERISESEIQTRILLEATRKGLRLWRNNVGAFTGASGSLVRYGLANTSSKVNSVIKSSDLIGIRPIITLQEHVGQTFGKFVAIEVKRKGWTYRGTPRELAQARFLELVRTFGGEAKFCNEEGHL
jgi:hypothetical protein